MHRAPRGVDFRYPIGHPLHQPGDETTHVDVTPYDPTHGKGSVYEAGHRVPLVVCGDPLGSPVGGVVVEPGRSNDSVVDCIDLYATFTEWAGLGETSSVASHSRRFGQVALDPTFTSTRAWSLSQTFRPNGFDVAARVIDNYGITRPDGTGNLWKLIRRLDGEEFYELDSDPLETSDLGTGHAEYRATADLLNWVLLGPPQPAHSVPQSHRW